MRNNEYYNEYKEGREPDEGHAGDSVVTSKANLCTHADRKGSSARSRDVIRPGCLHTPPQTPPHTPPHTPPDVTSGTTCSTKGIPETREKRGATHATEALVGNKTVWPFLFLDSQRAQRRHRHYGHTQNTSTSTRDDLASPPTWHSKEPSFAPALSQSAHGLSEK